jgi:hypothetical protein
LVLRVGLPLEILFCRFFLCFSRFGWFGSAFRDLFLFSRAVRLVRFRDFFLFFSRGSAGSVPPVFFSRFVSFLFLFLSRVSVFLSRGSVPPVFFLFLAVCFFRFLFFLVVPLFFSLAFFLFFPSQPYTKSK